MAIRGYATLEAGKPLEPFEYDPGELLSDDVEIEVEYCGICHSDLSMINNDWGISSYPFVPGHEAVGKIVATGPEVKHLAIGQRVGLGWRARSCMYCDQCMNGLHNRCQQVETGGDTIVGRHGGFGDRVRCQSSWAIPLPEGMEAKSAGPLFCGGITMFNPILQSNIKATDHVGVVGIGGLGHMALSFLNAWGCEVTAFSTNPAKEAEAKELGAHHFVNTKDAAVFQGLHGQFDMILVTVNVPLDWNAYINTLKTGGRLHIVGAIHSIEAEWFPILVGDKMISGSPLGSPSQVTQMLNFCARHKLAPMIEEFPMANVNDALEHLKAGKARYRIVLTN